MNRTRKEDTPCKVNLLTDIPTRDLFKQKGSEREGMTMSAILRRAIKQCIRGDLDIIINKNITIDNSQPYRINLMVEEEDLQKFKEYCTQKGANMSLALRSYVDQYISEEEKVEE